MASAVHSFSSCFTINSKLQNLSLKPSSPSTTRHSFAPFNSLGFSGNLSYNAFSNGILSLSPIQRSTKHSIVCEAAPAKKADSAAKRARQAEKRRIYNKSHKSEIKTRMKKVLEALESLRKKPDAVAEEILPVEKLIGDAYSVIDKAVKVGILHRNTGANRKSRLARRKKAVEIHHKWYTPDPTATTV